MIDWIKNKINNLKDESNEKNFDLVEVNQMDFEVCYLKILDVFNIFILLECNYKSSAI